MYGNWLFFETPDSNLVSGYDTVMNFKIGADQLTARFTLHRTKTYHIKNRSPKTRALVIEHPVENAWKLVEPAKADETTDALYRFKGHVQAGKGTKLTVEEQAVADERVAILPADVGQLAVYLQTGPIPQAVKAPDQCPGWSRR